MISAFNRAFFWRWKLLLNRLLFGTLFRRMFVFVISRLFCKVTRDAGGIIDFLLIDWWELGTTERPCTSLPMISRVIVLKRGLDNYHIILAYDYSIVRVRRPLSVIIRIFE